MTDFENAEKDRVTKLEERLKGISWMAEPTFNGAKLNLDCLKKNMATLQATVVDDSFQEFKAKASAAHKAAIASLEKSIDEAEIYETEQAELKKLRDEKDAREKKERDDRMVKEAADRAIESERVRVQRVKDQEENDRLAREKDVNHKRSVNKDIHASLMEILSRSFVEPHMVEGLAKALVIEIAKGNVPHVKVNY